jgi:cell wall assembly regulator SMI1
MNINECWEIFEKDLVANSANRFANLRPGPSDQMIASVESRLGLRLPRVVRKFYQIHDGTAPFELTRVEESQSEYEFQMCHCLVEANWWFLPLEKMVACWKERCELPSRIAEMEGREKQERDLDDAEEAFGRYPDMDMEQEFGDGYFPINAVKKDDWNKKWIPICDQDGDCLFIDFDPAEGGTYGQIVFYWHERPDLLRVVGGNFLDWMNDIAESVERGEYHLQYEPILDKEARP